MSSSDKAPMLGTASMGDTKSTASTKEKKAKAKAKTKAQVSSDVLVESYDAEQVEGDAGDTMVDVRSLAVPDSIKSILLELDMDGSGGGNLNEQHLKDALNLMKALKNGLDVDGSGGVSKLELEGGVELITRLARDRHANASTLEYTHMPNCIKDVLKEWDLDDSGHVCVTELAAAATAFKKVHQEGRMMRKIIFGLALVIVVLMVGVFVLSFAAIEVSKESHVENGKFVDLEGKVVSIKSADFEVCQDGTMTTVGKCPAAGASGRRLAEDDSSTLKTVPTKEKMALSSSLSDTFFMALDEVAVFSDKGHSLRLQIHGFARVPVLNSRCGNIVHLYTAWNGRLTLDSVDMSFDEATEAAFANAGFSLVTGGVSGRRLAGEHTVDGFFSAVQGVAAEGWSCQDVPLPSLPTTYQHQFNVYRPCAVEGVTADALDMCDSLYGGVLPGVDRIPRALQLATMSKTARIRASLSVDVPIDRTLFTKMTIETMKSSGYELQVTRFENHPGMLKIHLFDRSTSEDITFQLIDGHFDEGRFFCNATDSSEVTPQKKELEAEKKGIERKMHFEFLDTIEEDGKMLRHFRMMPSEAFVEWMGAVNASSRPVDGYYEYWDESDTMNPVRLLNPDGSLVHFTSVVGGVDDDAIKAKLKELGSAGWDTLMACTSEEEKYEQVMAARMGMEVPMMMSPMNDLSKEDFMFYAKLNLDEQVELNTGSGWTSMEKRSTGDGPLAAFSKYALRSHSPVAMADVCRDVCVQEIEALEAELKGDADLEFCDARALTGAVRCVIDIAAARNAQCLKSNFVSHINSECLLQTSNVTSTRRLFESEDGEEGDAAEEPGAAEDWDWAEDDDSSEGSEMYLRRMGRLPRKERTERKLQAMGEVKSHMRELSDGTMELDIDALDRVQREHLARAIGSKELKGGKIFFNSSDHSPNSKGIMAFLQASEESGSIASRRLQMEMNCIAPNVGPGCIFSVGYPWRCDPIDGEPPCSFGLAVKIQIGGPMHGALTVGGTGCIEEWAFGVPKPFKGQVCIDGGIEMSWTPACGLPFSLRGWVGITAKIGLDLIVFSFTAASIRIEGGASIENYKYNCDDRRRRRRGWGGRRRGADETCQHACDVRVYIKGTFSVFIGRVWALVQYWCKHRNFDLILGADIYIWLIFTGWWETVAQVTII